MFLCSVSIQTFEPEILAAIQKFVKQKLECKRLYGRLASIGQQLPVRSIAVIARIAHLNTAVVVGGQWSTQRWSAALIRVKIGGLLNAD